MCPAFHKRKAFTLIELMVVIAIVGLLASLVVPAVQRARESARRASCTNNLKQIGLALQNYHGSHNVFPSGWVENDEAYPPAPRTANNGFGWGAMILPDLGEQILHGQLNFNAGISGSNGAARANERAIGSKLKIFRCPSDVGPDTWNNMHGGGSVLCADQGTSNYLGSFGPNHWEGDGRSLPGDGVFFRNSAIAFRELRDGDSVTLMAGERAWKKVPSGDPPGGDSYWGGTPDNQGADVVSTTIARINSDGHSGYGSLHSHGAMFLFCDGSVKFLNENIDSFRDPNDPARLGTFQKLAHRSDGQNPGDF